MYQRIGNVVSLTVTLALWMSPAVAETPYYQGKTITIVAGTKAGDVYDLYARHFAQFLPKYIPGNPNIIVQNMAGAGSMIAANFVYNVANRDGLTIGAIFPALYFDQVVGRPEVKYDWSKFAWIGSPVTSNHLLYMRAHQCGSFSKISLSFASGTSQRLLAASRISRPANGYSNARATARAICSSSPKVPPKIVMIGMVVLLLRGISATLRHRRRSQSAPLFRQQRFHLGDNLRRLADNFLGELI